MQNKQSPFCLILEAALSGWDSFFFQQTPKDRNAGLNSLVREQLKTKGWKIELLFG